MLPLRLLSLLRGLFGGVRYLFTATKQAKTEKKTLSLFYFTLLFIQTVFLYDTLQIFYQENQFWSPPDNKSKSTSQKNLTCSLKSSDQQPDSQEMLIQKFESTNIDKVQENPRDENQQPIRYLVVPFVCPNKLCNWICFLDTYTSKLCLRMLE